MPGERVVPLRRGPRRREDRRAVDPVGLPERHVVRRTLCAAGSDHRPLGQAEPEAGDEFAVGVAVIDAAPVAEDHVVGLTAVDRVVPLAAEQDERLSRGRGPNPIVTRLGIEREQGIGRGGEVHRHVVVPCAGAQLGHGLESVGAAGDAVHGEGVAARSQEDVHIFEVGVGQPRGHPQPGEHRFRESPRAVGRLSIVVNGDRIHLARLIDEEVGVEVRDGVPARGRGESPLGGGLARAHQC